MSEVELEPREAMDYDVVVVGGGPAGLAAAIRLKQINPELSVVVVEKGSEIGAHILSGAVIDPIGLDKLLPGWREDAGLPAEGAGHGGPLLPARPLGRRSPAQFRHAAADEQSRQFRRLARQCLPLPRAKAEELGVEIYPGFAAAEVLYGDKGEVVGVATGDMGVGRDGAAEGFLHPRHGVARQIHLFAEGARGSLTKPILARFGLDEGREPQKFGIGIKELWQVDPAKHKPGLVQHTFGWPLDVRHRRRLVPLSYRGQSGCRRLRRPSQLCKNPTLSPFDEFQRFKTHPMVRETFEGGKRLAYGARAITEGGWQSVPKLVFPGGALIGCARRLHERAADQGLAQRHAVGHAGGGSGGARRSPPGAPMTNSPLTRRLAGGTDRRRPQKGAQRQAAVVEVRHLCSASRSAASTCGSTTCSASARSAR